MDFRALLLALPLLLAVTACGAAPEFPLRTPMAHDVDDRPFSPAPREYVSPFAWDGANQMVFRPVSRFFAVDPAGRAINVNAMDEVPDSSWFQNRIGRAPMTEAQVARGACDDKVLDPAMPDGTWIIDQGKPNGANPGFRVTVPGYGKFMLKSDPAVEPERATGATAIAARIYHAAGYFAPCDSVVYFRPSLLKLKPGLTVTDNSGVTRSFDEAMLAKVLAGASHRDGLVRMVASKWLPGKALGPFTYEGTRDDDPNDVVAHEDRRELRGARLLAAWLNHFDTREQNTMDVFLSDDKKRGYVRHYIIDLGDSFGSVWQWDEISRRLGHAYYLDIPYAAEDFVMLGAVERPWERAKRESRIFNYFSARDFDPEMWRGGYPNPAFARMTESDGAWMARILARFTDQDVRAAVSVGQYDEESTRFLVATLIARRDAILRRYLTRLSPLTDVRAEGNALCMTDLARQTHVAGDASFSYRARLFTGSSRKPLWDLRSTQREAGNVCFETGHVAGDGGTGDADPSRYVVLEVSNGQAQGMLRVHAYDLGPGRGFTVVAIERPN